MELHFELEFAKIFYVFWPEIAKKLQKVAAAYSIWGAPLTRLPPPEDFLKPAATADFIYSHTSNCMYSIVSLLVRWSTDLSM